MADNALHRAADAEQNQKTYQAVMRFSAEVGVPACMGLGMFFTQLVMAHGVPAAFLGGVLVYVAVLIVVKLFFSH